MAEEQFIVSARKYRPTTWETVVGQETISSTLQHAIDTGAILLQDRIPIAPNNTAGEIHDTMMEVGAQL